MDRAVIVLGGGTVRYEWNRDAMRGTGVNVLLTAEFDVIADRVRVNDRPRVHPGTALEEDLELIWGGNKDLYLEWADLTCRTDRGRSPEEEADELVEILQGVSRG
jgi:shikimate kinase